MAFIHSTDCQAVSTELFIGLIPGRRHDCSWRSEGKLVGDPVTPIGVDQVSPVGRCLVCVPSVQGAYRFATVRLAVPQAEDNGLTGRFI